MIRWRVIDIEKRFPRNGDYVPLADCQYGRAFKTKWKLLSRPTKNNCPILAPVWTDRNFRPYGSDFVSGRVFKRDVNVAVCFNSQIDNAACELVPLLLRG